MTHPPRALLPAFAVILLTLAVAGCDMFASGVTPTPTPAVSTAAPERTTRPRRTARPTTDPAGASPAGDLAATPRPTRRPRPSPTPTPSPTPQPTPMPEIAGFAELAGADGRLTVLLLGSDARKGLAGERTDTIMVATIDPTNGKVAMVSLPRDTVNVPIGPGEVFTERINGLLQDYRLRGSRREQALRKMTKAMAYAFDTEIDHYALIGFNGVKRLVNRIGGVDVVLANALWDPTMHITRRGLKLKEGKNHLNGARALAFARTRHSDSDYQRAGRQQQLIAAAAVKTMALGQDALPALADLAAGEVETDIPLSAAPVLFQLAERARLGGFRSVVLSPYTYARDGRIIYTIEMNTDVVRALFDRLFGPVRR